MQPRYLIGARQEDKKSRSNNLAVQFVSVEFNFSKLYYPRCFGEA